jgi:hypothetical protein
LHFGESATHHGSAAEQLDTEMAHSRMPVRGLSRKRKSQSYVVHIAVRRRQSCAQRIRGFAYAFVRQGNQLFFLILRTLNKSAELPAPKSGKQVWRSAAPCAQ